jgi:light-harvesting complex I chlorophyll a/b binding protein 5
LYELRYINLLSINRYPGGPLLNPLGLAKDIKNAHDWKLKEIKNGIFFSRFFILCRLIYNTPKSVLIVGNIPVTGRLAMVAILGIFVQASVTHVGPIDNLVEHLSNPWHKTIIQTLASSSS